MRRAGHDVELLDLTFARCPYRSALAAARRRQPELVGITIRNIDNCNLEHPVFYLPEIRDEVIRAVREGAPAARIALGGAGLNIAPRAVLEFLGADFALVGEGEATMPGLLAALEDHRELAAVPGLLRAGRAGAATAARSEPCPRVLVEDLRHAPPSETFAWVDPRPYVARGAAYPVQTKRGCAQRCTYCAYNEIEGRAYRLRAPAAVADEVYEAMRGHRRCAKRSPRGGCPGA
jgi:radical SAM superfamily enzyme YgiQ (UPF0313 family)